MVRRNLLLGAGAIAIIAVPLGYALKQDLARDPAPAAPAATVPGPATSASPAPVIAHAPRTRMDHAFFRDVLGASKPRPALVGPLFRVQWDVTRDELRQIAPELFAWHHPDVTIHPLLDEDGRVAGIEIEFPDDGAAIEALRAAWGDGAKGRWESAEDHLAAYLSPGSEPGRARIVFSRTRR